MHSVTVARIGQVSARNFVGSVAKYSMCVKPMTKVRIRSREYLAGLELTKCCTHKELDAKNDQSRFLDSEFENLAVVKSIERLSA